MKGGGDIYECLNIIIYYKFIKELDMRIMKIFLTLALILFLIIYLISIVKAGDIKGKLIGEFTATGYTLSVESCGKSKSDEEYGITANGFDLSGLSRKDAMTVATDENVIPIGTKIYLEFPEEYENLNGIYISRDTGSAIKGNKIDIYMGEDLSYEEVCEQIGKQKIKVYNVLEK